jgi:hypothetical protein
VSANHQVFVAGLIHARHRDPDAFAELLDTMSKADVYALTWDYVLALSAALTATDEQLAAHVLRTEGDDAPG